MNDGTAKRKAALWVGAVFLLGAALGGLLGYAFVHSSYAAPATQLTDQAKRQQRVAQLTQDLSLTNDQQHHLERGFARWP